MHVSFLTNDFVDIAELSVIEGGSSSVVDEERTFCFGVAVIAA